MHGSKVTTFDALKVKVKVKSVVLVWSFCFWA